MARVMKLILLQIFFQEIFEIISQEAQCRIDIIPLPVIMVGFGMQLAIEMNSDIESQNGHLLS